MSFFGQCEFCFSFSEFTQIFWVYSDFWGLPRFVWFYSDFNFQGRMQINFFCAATHPCCTLPCWEGQRHLGGPKSWVTKKFLRRRSWGNQTTCSQLYLLNRTVGQFCTMTPGWKLVWYSPKPVGSFPLKAFPNPDQLPLVIFCHCYNAVPKGKLSHKGTYGRIIESQSFVSEGNFEFNLQIIGIAIELYV